MFFWKRLLLEFIFGCLGICLLLGVYSLFLICCIVCKCTYWRSIFILPKKIVRAIEQKFNRFHRNGKDEGIARAKISRNMLFLPKKEGSLGIKKLDEWNRAAMMRHIWSFFVWVGSLWVAWVKEMMLKGRSFWQVSIPQNCTWSRRKLLKVRDDA